MSKNTKIVLAIIVVIAVGAFVKLKSSKNSSVGAEPIKIGGVFALTGDAAAWGEADRNGAQLAVEDINSRGGINGHPVQLIVEDMQSSSKGSISAVSKLINIDKVSAIVGPSWMDVYQGVGDLVKNNNIVLMSPDAGIEAINGDVVHRNLFSTWYRSDVKAKLIVDYMAKQGIKKLAQLYQNDPYYTDFAARIKKYADQDGIQIVTTELINSGATDVRTPALKIKASGADAVIFGLYDEKSTFNFLRIKKDSFPNMPLFGDELAQDHYSKPEYIDLYENIVYFSAAQPDKNFSDTYTAKFKTTALFGAAPSYDATMILSKAIEDKGVGADYNTYLRSTTFKSVTYGSVTFDEIGGVKTKNNQFDLWKVVNNKAVKISL